MSFSKFYKRFTTLNFRNDMMGWILTYIRDLLYSRTERKSEYLNELVSRFQRYNILQYSIIIQKSKYIIYYLSLIALPTLAPDA